VFCNKNIKYIGISTVEAVSGGAIYNTLKKLRKIFKFTLLSNTFDIIVAQSHISRDMHRVMRISG